MNHTLFRSMTLAVLACAVPAVTEAQVCGDAINCTITRPRPVVSTQLHAQQVTTFRDVTETQVCHKQVVENVPITTSKNVTVDEGGYQMVWVSKPVTKQVCQTTMQQQVKTVAVPVQVTRRVPQISTQMVPVQTVQYVNETVPVQPMAMAVAPTCNTCGNSGMIGMQMRAPQIGLAPIPYQPAPYTSAAIPTMPAITVPQYQSALAPIPANPGVMPSRSASNSYEETVPARGVPTPRDEAVVTPRKTSMFQGVPSAAAVWQRQSTYAR